jgi:hypothetical protein
VAGLPCRKVFGEVELSLQWNLELSGLLLAFSSFMQNRKGIPSGKGLAERKPL